MGVAGSVFMSKRRRSFPDRARSERVIQGMSLSERMWGGIAVVGEDERVPLD